MNKFTNCKSEIYRLNLFKRSLLGKWAILSQFPAPKQLSHVSRNSCWTSIFEILYEDMVQGSKILAGCLRKPTKNLF